MSNEESPELIVSVATYPKRFNTTQFLDCVQSILNQKTKLKYKFIVNIYNNDIKFINNSTYCFLQKNNIEIFETPFNLKSHNKYFFTMMRYRNIPILTIDDDMIYHDDMIEKMYNCHLENTDSIIGGRCHLIRRDNSGDVLKYSMWNKDYTKITEPSEDLFSVGNGGILYPPKFSQLIQMNHIRLIKCLNANCCDDVFLKYLQNINGFKVKLCCSDREYVKPNGYFVNEHTQLSFDETALYKKNVLESNNDRVLKILNPIKHHTVAYISDINYLGITYQSIQSLLFFNPGFNVHLFYVKDYQSNNEELENIKNLSKNIHITTIDNNNPIYSEIELIRENAKIQHVSKAALVKFLLPKLLPQNLSKVLYIDCDTLISNNISHMFNLDISEKYAGVCPDKYICDKNNSYMQGKTSMNDFYQKLVTSNSSYFNSGVLLINLKKWREDNISDKLIKFASSNITIFADQDTFNQVIGNNVLWLPQIYNQNYNDKYPLNDVTLDSLIIHISGPNKSKFYKNIFQKFGMVFV